MAQITSQEELEAWLKDKPTDWAQVIAARAALRVLPYAFTKRIPHDWVAAHSLALFRATAISWAASNFPAQDMSQAADAAAAASRDARVAAPLDADVAAATRSAVSRAVAASAAAAAKASSVSAAYAARAAASTASGVSAAYVAPAADSTASGFSAAAFSRAAAAIDAVLAVAAAADASSRAAAAASADARSRAIAATSAATYASRLAAADNVWANISHDCERLASESESGSAAHRLTHQPLWPAGEPDEWREARAFADARVAGLNQGYGVWIDWYDRRINGERAAFDIPGDTDRTHDKAILARLADATNDDFWDKGATYVNTTLQSWIDEARERAAIDYVASGAPLNLGSDAELAVRDELASRLASVEAALAALKDQLASLTQTGHGGIGHNQPENATSLRDDEIITLKQQVASLETLLTEVQTQLAKPVPVVGQLVQDMPKLNRWGRAMCVIADMSSDKVAEGFEKEIGAAGAKGLVAGLVAVVLAALAAFSHYFYTYWIPLLIG